MLLADMKEKADGVTVDEEVEEVGMGGTIKYQPTKNYMGMLEYKKDEESALIRNLIIGMLFYVYSMIYKVFCSV